MNTEKEKIALSEYSGYSENQGVISCPKCGKDIWCSIPDEGQEVSCQSHDCDWEGVFYKELDNEK
ncbi:hypothetical protein [Chryseobacterium sp. WX]|uniref:hypothetical protein n=1 Tax=Chryseobacterium sp. WX TaxID=3031803 RepID=UPI00240993F8|nr:hypothetical protein [Chryseobacterium sp. WX]WFB67043.1 hypothetical protein PZ898_20365 [Chryseobacterium sp. WX]